MTVAVGVDLGGTKIHGVVVEGTTVLAERRVATRPGSDQVVADVADLVSALLVASGTGTESVEGIGVGLPGVIDPVAGTVAHAVNLGLAEEFPLAARLSAAVGRPVRLGNDVDAAALGAAELLNLIGRDVAYLSIGTGLAAGLLHAGEVHVGELNVVGEVGHVPVFADGERCKCGQRGCLETVVSGPGIERRWRSRSALPAAADLFRAATDGDPTAVAVRDGFADGIAHAVQMLVLLHGVGVVLLGGGVSRVGSALLTATREACSARAASSPFLASLDLAGRVRLAPEGPLPALGAALVLRQVRPRGVSGVQVGR